MDAPVDRLQKKFKRKHRLIESEIGKTEKSALQRLLKEGRVVRLRAYYLSGYEPTLQSESERILQKLLSRPSLFRRTALRSGYKESQPFFRPALSKLLAEKRVVRLGVSGTDGEYFIHRDHLVNMLDSSDSRPSKPAETYLGGDNRKKLTSRIYKAYERLARDKGRRSVFISDLQTEEWASGQSGKLTKAVFFRTPELSKVPKPNWKATGEIIEKAMQRNLELITLTSEETARLYSARDLYNEALAGNADGYSGSEVLEFLVDELGHWRERLLRVVSR